MQILGPAHPLRCRLVLVRSASFATSHWKQDMVSYNVLINGFLKEGGLCEGDEHVGYVRLNAAYVI